MRIRITSIEGLQDVMLIRCRPCWITSGAFLELEMAGTTGKKALLPGYKATLCDPQSKKRYEEKLVLLGGKDPYEIPAEAWKDDVVLWPPTTYIHVNVSSFFSESLHWPGFAELREP